MISDYFSIAFKNLKHRGIRSWLTLLGIFIGVMAVVALMSLGSGLKLAVSSQFGVSATELITVQAGGLSYGPPGSYVANPLTIDDLETIQKISSVKQAIRRNMDSGKLEYNNHLIFGYAASVPSGEDRKFLYEQLELETIEGRLLKDGDSGKVVLGYNFYANKVGLEKPVLVGKKVLIQDEEFEVVGIADKQGSLIYDNIVLMNEADMKNLFNYGDVVDIISVQPRDKNSLDKTKEDIEKVLRDKRDVEIGKEDFQVSTPESSLAQINKILNGIQIFIAIVASISILVGAIGIVNTMTTSVLERRREIGIMKAIGATNFQIFIQFFIEASLLGLIGGFLGALCGASIGFVGTMGINAWIGAQVQPAISFWLIFFSLLGSFLLGGLAGILPALDAAKQNPVEAIRE
jgi:putative ABC transport system permease protein